MTNTKEILNLLAPLADKFVDQTVKKYATETVPVHAQTILMDTEFFFTENLLPTLKEHVKNPVVGSEFTPDYIRIFAMTPNNEEDINAIHENIDVETLALEGAVTQVLFSACILLTDTIIYAVAETIVNAFAESESNSQDLKTEILSKLNLEEVLLNGIN